MTTPNLVIPISADDFASNHALVVNTLTQTNPILDLSTGSALDGLLVENEAQLCAIHQSQLTNLSESFSLAALNANLATATTAQVDSLLSNYGIVRKTATAATGPVTIIIENAIPYQIPAGFTFTYNSLQFKTTQAIYAFPPSSTVPASATNRVMTLLPNNTYQFTLTVTATTAGSASALTAGTVLIITSPLAGMVSATAATDFTGGTDTETNAQLLARCAPGITAQILCGPASIQSILSAQFPGIVTSVVGLGSPLMTRDQDPLFNISQGSKQDIYCRTAAFAPITTLASLSGVVQDNANTVRLSIPYAQGVGVYRAIAIRLAGSTSLGGDVPTQTIFANYFNTTYVPRLVLPYQGAYSANSTISVVFTDTQSGTLTNGTIVKYDVDIVWMPSIASVTAFATSSSIRPAGQDYLVRGGIPCSLTVATTIRVPQGASPPDTVAIAQAVANAVNALPFNTPSISQYMILTAISSVLTQGDAINTTMRGTIYAPDGTNITLPSVSELIIPSVPASGVGPANTFFSIAPSQVGITVVSR